MNRIQLLDNLTINKIAAGEVVERPSSVVKELIENSVDAGATSITIEVADGGTTMVKISDNGSGIAKDQVKTAFLRHATSKIKYVEDLERVYSLGFRGEALASISSVSQLEIITRTAEDESGVHLKIEGGTVVDEESTGAVTGTSITVKNLFYNVPARKKFLKKASTESGYITDVVNKAAMGNPGISFKYINNKNLMLHTPGNGDLKTVALYVFGKDFAKKMLDLSFSDKVFSVKGLIGKPELSRATRSYEYLFINGRPVKSSVVSSAVEEAFKTRLMGGKFPVFIMDLTVDLTMVDVNVHPAKLEVRFNNDTEVYDFIFKAVSKCLEGENLIPEASWESKNSKPVKEFFDSHGIAPIPETKQETLEDHFYDKIFHSSEQKGERSQSSDFKSDYGNSKPFSRYGYKINPVEHTIFEETTVEKPSSSKIDELLNYSRSKEEAPKLKQEVAEYKTETEKTVSERKPFFNSYKIIGQIFNTYWMIEQGESLFVIDQHAAHERVLFEQFSNKLKEENVSSQRLIDGEKLFLTDSERDTLSSNAVLLNKLGFDIEKRGEDYYLLSVPFIFKNPTGTGFLNDILDSLTQSAPETVYDTKLDTIATMACKAAVKGNDRLTYAEAEGLVRRLLELENPFTCPHGRPTIIELTKYELEKKFKRIL